MINQFPLRQNINEAVESLKDKGVAEPHLAIVLGTGLGKLVDQIEIIQSIEYSTIPHFAISTVETHNGRLIYGVLAGKKVIALQGRFHYYEGYNMKQITFPIYVLKALGVKYLFISNAAGNMNLDWKKGELMLLDDHINLLPENPLRGENDESVGLRYPDMSSPYSRELNDLIKKSAIELNENLREGIYISVQGPNLETRAEYRMLRNMGADVVGMSTVPEVIAANHIALPVAAISVLTDDCDPDNLKPANITEILKIAGIAETRLSELLKLSIQKLPSP